MKTNRQKITEQIEKLNELKSKVKVFKNQDKLDYLNGLLMLNDKRLDKMIEKLSKWSINL